MTDAEVIESLIKALDDKLQALADRLGESSQTVFNWKTLERGISWRRRSDVADLARELKVKIPGDFVKVKRPPVKRARAA